MIRSAGLGDRQVLLHDTFDFHARTRGDLCFARCLGTTLSYAEAYERSVDIAQAFAASGVVAGDRICLLQRNSIEGLLLIFAASRIGAVLVPINYRLSPREWVDLTADAEARLFFTDPDLADQFDAALSERALPFDLIKVSLAEERSGWRSLTDYIAVRDSTTPLIRPSDGDVIFQMYTSGTTGRSKGALLSHRGMLANIHKSNASIPYRLNPGERSLVVLPLFHIAAISTALCAIATGACLIIHRDVDLDAIVTALQDDEIVVASLVPAVIQFLLTGVPGIERMSFPKLKYLGYGASPIAASLLRKVLDVFACHVAQGYGMTEIGGVATLLNEVDHRRALAGQSDLLLSAGKPFPGTQIKIVSREGDDLPTGEIGEILISGDELFVGYWRQPEATAAALADGWFHTGDAGYLDAEGYLYIRDRIKDMIVTGAENVYPVEVETVLFDHPAVSDASVIGVPDDRWGETVMAIIVLRDGHGASAEELDRFCRQRLGGFKVPRRYEFVATLPRNAAGKVLKRELRHSYWQGHDRAVS
jgi:fatty-acyl-CoA synthase